MNNSNGDGSNDYPVDLVYGRLESMSQNRIAVTGLMYRKSSWI
jgi:hypothetical protein